MVQVSPIVSPGLKQAGLEPPWGCGRSISAAPEVKQRNQNALVLMCQRAVSGSAALPEKVKDQRGLTHCPFYFPLRAHTGTLAPLETQ